MFTNHRLAIAGTCLLGILLLLAPAASAWAQTAKASAKAERAEAKRFLRQGTAAYQRREYDLALEKFQRAYEVFPSPRIFYNLGQVLRELRRPVEATVAFETFLKESDRITSRQRKETRAALRELEPEVSRVTLLTNVDDVEIGIDGAYRGKTPLDGPLILAPGVHEIALVRTGYTTLRETITVAGDEERRFSLVLERSPPVTEPLVLPPVAPGSTEPAPTSEAAPGTTPAPTSEAAPGAAPGPTSEAAPAPGDPALAPPVPSPVPPPVPSPVPPPAAADLAPPSGGPTPDPPQKGWRTRKTLGLALLGASALFAAGGIGMLAASWARQSDAKDQGCNHNCEDAADQVDTRALWSKILFGGALLSGAGSAAIFFVYPTGGGSREQAAKPDGVVFVGRGTF